MKRYFFWSFFAGLLFAGTALASTGFVTAPLWLSPENPKDGDVTTLTVVFHNAETDTLSGTVLFYDGTVLLDRKPITVASNQIATVSTSFTMSAGSHQFSATMSGVGTLTGTGAISPVSLSTTTVKLPSKVVSKKIVPKKIGLSAQASDATNTASEKPILNQIDSAEQNVLKVIPAPTKTAIAGIAGHLDAWRQAIAAKFSTNVDAAKKELDDLSKTKDVQVNSILGSKTVKEQAAPAGPLDTPFAYVKLFFFVALTFLFSNPIIFYIIGILLVYFVLRFIIRKIGKSRKSKSLSKQSAKSTVR